MTVTGWFLVERGAAFAIPGNFTRKRFHTFDAELPLTGSEYRADNLPHSGASELAGAKR